METLFIVILPLFFLLQTVDAWTVMTGLATLFIYLLIGEAGTTLLCMPVQYSDRWL